jgi:hypothetical protein
MKMRRKDSEGVALSIYNQSKEQIMEKLHDKSKEEGT